MGMFKKKSRSDLMTGDRSSGGIRSPGNSNTVSPNLSTSNPTVVYGTTRNKKGGFGSKLKGLVRISSKRSPGDVKSSGGKDSMQDLQDVPSTSPRLIRKIVEQFEESDSSSSSSSSGEEFRQQLGTVTEVNEDEYNSDIEPISTKTISGITASSESPTHTKPPSKSKRFGGGKKVEITNPMPLVILLIDPTFQKFELLRLQHHQPKKMRVKDVLTYFRSSISNHTFKELKFVGLVDREGRVHGPSAKLSKAVSQEGDILVGLVKGVQDVAKVMKAARPILGDSKVGKLLDINGFDTKGWVTKKKTKASILDKAQPSQNESQGGGTVTLVALTMVMLALLVATDALIAHLNNKDMFVQPLISWEFVLQGTGQWVVNGAKGLVSNKIVDESSTFMPESTATVAENLVSTTAKPKVVVDTAKDLVMTAAATATTKVAEVVSTSISNNMTSNATSTITDTANVKAIKTSNSVWEEYAVIALLVCILLNWLAM